jgi:hypothetical protein
MVKNQNWQKRVETADARRKQAKQRKQTQSDKRHFKKSAQEFLALLERHDERLDCNSIHRIDIWSSTFQQCDGVLIMEQQDEEETYVRSRRRSRAASMDSISTHTNDCNNTKQQRGRSNSVSEHSKRNNKKTRRKDSFGRQEEEEEEQQLLLCKPYFFTDACPHNGNNKKGCKHVHYPPRYKTLFQAVKEDSKQELQLSKQALEEHESDAMDMLYHSSLQVTSDNDSSSSVHNQLTSFLSNQHHIPLASLVYVVMDGILVYDRNREGLLVHDDLDFLLLLLGEHAIRNRKFSSQHEEASQDILIHFPAAVLEHVLSFLPDQAVAAACRVCTLWFHEIGQHSAHLWRNMLQRRHWPLPLVEDQGMDAVASSLASRNQFRNAFIRHYTVLRDVAALQKGLTAIKTRSEVSQTEMTYQDFSKRRHAPSVPNASVAVQVWSANHVLAAYSQDCSLRLFEASASKQQAAAAAATTTSGTPEKQCREIACQCIDPYKSTRRKRCCILSMDLDDNYIGCLCHVAWDEGESESYNLVVLSRDDYLLGESSTADADDLDLIVIDIGEAVVNCLLSADEFDHRLLLLTDFFQDGGEIDELQIFTSNSLAACGHGRFMVEVAICLPEDMVPHGETGLLVRKLVLFSAEVGVILWMGESNPVGSPMMPAAEFMTLSRMRQSYPGSSDSVCTVAVGSLLSSEFIMCEIDTSGQVQIHETLQAPGSLASNLINDGWRFHSPFFCQDSILITPSHVITANIMVRSEMQDIQEKRSLITFHSPQSPSSTIELPGDTEVIRMARLRDLHAIVLCRTFTNAPSEVSAEREGGGHWLRAEMPLPESSQRIDVHAFIYHVPTRCQVGRICLLEDVSNDRDDVPRITVDSGDTLGVALSFKGLAMAGSNVRSVEVLQNDVSSPRSGKKKKSGRAKRRAKKDEFARGMRQNSG